MVDRVRFSVDPKTNSDNPDIRMAYGLNVVPPWADRKMVVFWTPGKNLLSNPAIPCIHADPYFGDLKPGESRSARGVLIFTRTSLEKLVEELAEKAEQPW